MFKPVVGGCYVLSKINRVDGKPATVYYRVIKKADSDDDFYDMCVVWVDNNGDALCWENTQIGMGNFKVGTKFEPISLTFFNSIWTRYNV